MGAVARAALAAALVALTSTAPALAQVTPPTPSRVRIEPPACAAGPFDVQAWLSLVRTEIETDGVDAVVVEPAPEGNDPSLAVIRVEVEPCSEEATEAAVTIDDLLTRKTLRRVVALDDIPRAGRARALALAVAELLRASWAEFALQGSHAAQATVPPAVRRAVLLRLRPAVLAERPPEAPARPTPPVRRWWAGATFGVHSFPGQSGSLRDIRLVGTWRVPVPILWRMRLDAGGSWGEAIAPRGRIDLRMASVGVGAFFGGGNDLFEFTFGPRFEGGLAWASGESNDPRVRAGSGDGPVLFFSLHAMLRVALGSRAHLLLDVAGGETLVYVTAYDGIDRATGLQGTFLSVALGGGFAW